MQQPLDALVADLVSRLGESHREWFEERAGIVEFDAGHSRADSERMALLMLLQRYPGALLGVTAMQMTFGGETRWALTVDLDRARLILAELGAFDVRVVDLADVLRALPGAIAFIEPLRKSDHLI